MHPDPEFAARVGTLTEPELRALWRELLDRRDLPSPLWEDRLGLVSRELSRRQEAERLAAIGVPF